MDGFVQPDTTLAGCSNPAPRVTAPETQIMIRVPRPSVDCSTLHREAVSVALTPPHVEAEVISTISSVAVGRAVVVPPVNPALGDRTTNKLFPFGEDAAKSMQT